ncbi:MAG: N-acetyltransferase [Propionibacteriales bacterium]|nr:N-acetyltransferase [Propionibacteriales bacterium]
MTITIRPARADDYRSTEELVRDAFWDLYRPGCVEHLIIHQARKSDELLIDLVAIDDDGLLGSLIVTRAQIVDASGQAAEVGYLGPIGVRPDRQRTGVGSALMRAGLDQLTEQGFVGVFLFGDPGYYGRFGFADAVTWAITTPDGLNFPAFMGLELRAGGLNGVQGRLAESPAFEVDSAALTEFDQQFEPREAHVLPGQFGQ